MRHFSPVPVSLGASVCLCIYFFKCDDAKSELHPCLLCSAGVVRLCSVLTVGIKQRIIHCCTIPTFPGYRERLFLNHLLPITYEHSR